jgi:predicted transcriptional regulator
MPKIKLKLMGSMTPWTKTPNIIIDKLMPMLRDTEMRVLLILLRSTVGWNRGEHPVMLSYSMLMQRSGRSSEAISKALKALEDRGLIHITHGRRRKPRLNPKLDHSESEGLYKTES